MKGVRLFRSFVCDSAFVLIYSEATAYNACGLGRKPTIRNFKVLMNVMLPVGRLNVRRLCSLAYVLAS